MSRKELTMDRFDRDQAANRAENSDYQNRREPKVYGADGAADPRRRYQRRFKRGGRGPLWAEEVDWNIILKKRSMATHSRSSGLKRQ